LDCGDHVGYIAPSEVTAPITQFLQKGTALEPGPAAAFYVAVTRAQ